MPVYLNSKIKVNEGKHNFIVDTPELYSNNATYEYYSGERMYPPTRTLSSSAHTISGESYGNGLYITDQSTYHSLQWAGFSAFRESVNVGYHGAASQYNTSGTYLKSHYIISDYKGEWLTIKMPASIYLTRYAFTLRTTSYLGRAPKKYKIYGSNNGTDWEVLVHKDDADATPVYTNSRFEESIQMTNKSYNHFGLVVNKLIGGSSNSNTLNLNEWYIYGKESITTPEKSYEEQTNVTEYTILESDSTNLVAWYKFDDDSNKGLNSSVSPNSIGNAGYNGTPTLDSSEYVIGKSSYFSGSGDHSFVLDDNSDNLYNAIYQKPISISFWLKSLSAGQTNQGRVFYGSPTGSSNNTNAIQCWHRDGNSELTFVIVNNGESNDGNYMATTQLPPFNTAWSHVTLVIEPQSTNWTTKEHTAKIYVNGVLDGTFTNIWYPLITQNYDFEIGKWTTTNQREYNGYLDDFRIYDKALSRTEIYYLANNLRLIPEYKYLTFKYDNTKYPHLDADDTNLKIWYKFDDNGNDSNPSSTKYNLTNNGVSFVDGIVNKAALFNNNSDLLTSQTFHLSNKLEIEFTFSLWIKVKSGISSYGQVFQYYQDGNNNIYMRRQNANYLIFWIWQNGAYLGSSLSSSNYTLDEWRLYTITYNSVEARLYINGALHQSVATNGSVLRIRNGYLLIGDRTNSDQHFWGELDDFRIYNKALTESEINDLYNQYNQNKYYLTFNNPVNCDILIVAGGGGGGGGLGQTTNGDGTGGGGGGGGLVFLPNIIVNDSYIIRVGNGGEGREDAGENGYNSSIEKQDGQGINGITNFLALGGGGGGDGRTTSQYSGPGNVGGSGGGGGGNSTSSGGESIQNTYNGKGFGNSGGNSLSSSGDQSGGGGGAGSVGQSSHAATSGNVQGGEGGMGLHKVTIDGIEYKFKDLFGISNGEYIVDGTTARDYGTAQDYINRYYHADSDTYVNPIPAIEEGVYFAGGGAGKNSSTTGGYTYGGLGGGASVLINNSGGLKSGIEGTGGGGTGGGKQNNHPNAGVLSKGTNGGSGIVIIRYKNADINQWTYSYSNPNTYYLGNVGIGTLSSQENKLTIGGDLNVTNKIYKNNVEISNIDGWNKNGQNIYRENGKVGIGTTEPQYTLDINGDIYAMDGGVTGDGSTSWTTISDRNLKENIVKASYKECYDNIKNIDLYRFNYKKGFDTSRDKHQLGFIAQEVKEYYPKSVIETNNSAKGVDNILKLDVTQINYSLFGAVKHSIKEIEEIEEKIANNTN